MKFSKEEFLKNAPTGIKKQLKDHIDTIDGMEVVFEDEECGYIQQYFVEGKEYYLYPVYESWCRSEQNSIETEQSGQMRLEDIPGVLP